jgi:anti-sigma-K factor RskA
MHRTDATGDFEMAEYVLGLLDGPQNDAMERRLRKDDNLRAIYSFWIQNFSSLDAAFKPQPSPVAYAAIERRLFGVPQRKSTPLWIKLAVACGILVVLVIKLKIIMAMLQ